MTTVSAERLAKVFVEVADTLVDEFDLIEFLQMLTDRVASLVDDSTVGLLLADPRGHLQFMAAPTRTPNCWSCISYRTRRVPAWTPTAPPNR